MPKRHYDSITDHTFLNREIDVTRRKIKTRKKEENKGKYSDEEIQELENKLEELIKTRDMTPYSDKIGRPPTNLIRTIREDVQIAKELHYPDQVINQLRNEPDEKKRQKILRNARESTRSIYDIQPARVKK